MWGEEIEGRGIIEWYGTKALTIHNLEGMCQGSLSLLREGIVVLFPLISASSFSLRV